MIPSLEPRKSTEHANNRVTPVIFVQPSGATLHPQLHATQYLAQLNSLGVGGLAAPAMVAVAKRHFVPRWTDSCGTRFPPMVCALEEIP